MRPPKQHAAKTKDEIASAEAQIVELSKRIEFYLTEYSIELLAAKVMNGEFVVPSYQRSFTWEEDRKSRFIESVLLGLPIPFLFFWEMPNGKLEIVDGSQRLRTIAEFVHGDFRLGELESLTKLSNFTFSDLPESRKRKINNRSIRGIVLNEHADEQARFDLFERINTGSKIANQAEVRRGALAGDFMTLIIELALDPRLKTLAPVSTKDEKERGREDLVTRLFAYGDGLQGYKDRPAEFLFSYVKAMNERVAADPNLIQDYRRQFDQVMNFVERVFPYGFRKTQTAKATPRARFEAIAIGTRLALNDDPALYNAQNIDVQIWLDSDEFKRVTGSDGANAVARLRERIGFVQQRLLGN